MRSSSSPLPAALIVLALLLPTGCARDAITDSAPAPDLSQETYLPQPIAPEALEIVSIDETRTVLRVHNPGGPPLLVELYRLPGTTFIDQTSIVVDGRTVTSDSLSSIVIPPLAGVILLGLSAIQFIYGCALPVYREAQRSGNPFKQEVVVSCVQSGVESLFTKGLGRFLRPAVKVTALRNDIYNSMIGGVITRQQLQRQINKKTKSDIAELFAALTVEFFGGVVNALQGVYNKHGISYRKSAAPDIVAIRVNGTVQRAGRTFTDQVRYIDPDGDVVNIAFEVRSGFSWRRVNTWSFYDRLGVYEGSIPYTAACSVIGTYRGRVVLKDMSGNTSSREYQFTCAR
ncbi:MAG TPA: hypothetical protein VEQ60_03330 [Longimicrobium sp.]|nr:hypothetical protein [Longimicrobium sp.]